MYYSTTVIKRIVLFGIFVISIAVLLGLLVSILTNEAAYTSASRNPQTTAEPFPIGVNPADNTITEQDLVQDFYRNNLAQADADNTSWWNRLANELQTSVAFQQLASPVSRVIVIWPGERTEEATQNIGDVMRWNTTERREFSELMKVNEYQFTQGFALPGQYISHRQATPAEIALLLQTEFAREVTAKYTSEINDTVPLADALIIASMIEREASDFENMREISGVIWNRLFIDMRLQLDATLQYVKAENTTKPNWWPAVRPPDKFIDSDFNTYQNTGLPPGPIANPSVAAIVATLNPRETDCLYYFHSRSREYYCSETYEEHVRKLQEVYGQGS